MPSTVFYHSCQFLDPLPKIMRNASIAPPSHPFQGLVDFHLPELCAELLPTQSEGGSSLVFLKISAPHEKPLLFGPLSKRNADQIKTTGAQSRCLPINDGERPIAASSAHHNVFSKKLAVD